MAEPLQDETRLVSLLGLVQRQLHDEYHRQWTERDGEEGKPAKEVSRERLHELLEMVFPGKDVTVTDASGKTLYEGEKEGAEEDDEPEEKAEDDDDA